MLEAWRVVCPCQVCAVLVVQGKLFPYSQDIYRRCGQPTVYRKPRTKTKVGSTAPPVLPRRGCSCRRGHAARGWRSECANPSLFGVNFKGEGGRRSPAGRQSWAGWAARRERERFYFVIANGERNPLLSAGRRRGAGVTLGDGCRGFL